MTRFKNFFFSFRNLGNNIFPTLPTDGLDRLLHLKTFNNPKLRVFPEPEMFPRIQSLVLSYAYHCCAFLPLVPSGIPTKFPPKVHESVLFPTDNEFDMSLWNSSMTDIWPQLRKFNKLIASIHLRWYDVLLNYLVFLILVCLRIDFL